MGKVEGSGSDRICTALYCVTNAQGLVPYKCWEATDGQLDLPSLTPLSVAGCGRLQLGVAHWAASIALLQVIDNRPHKLWY